MTREAGRPCTSLQPGPQLPSHLLGKYEVGQCGLALEQAQRPLFSVRAFWFLEPLLVGHGGWAQGSSSRLLRDEQAEVDKCQAE